MIGSAEAGDKIFFDGIINSLASACAFSVIGKWTAIWSQSKSALKAEQESGCNCIAFHSIKTGLKAWIESLWRVGALFSKTYFPSITSSKASQTSLLHFSIYFSACFML